jgi:hypothetical protein
MVRGRSSSSSAVSVSDPCSSSTVLVRRLLGIAVNTIALGIIAFNFISWRDCSSVVIGLLAAWDVRLVCLRFGSRDGAVKSMAEVRSAETCRQIKQHLCNNSCSFKKLKTLVLNNVNKYNYDMSRGLDKQFQFHTLDVIELLEKTCADCNAVKMLRLLIVS